MTTFSERALPRIVSRSPVYCSSIRTMSSAEFAERGEKTAQGGRFLCSDHENNTQHSYGCLVALLV